MSQPNNESLAIITSMSKQTKWRTELCDALWLYVKQSVVKQNPCVTNPNNFWKPPVIADNHITEAFKLLLLLNESGNELSKHLQQIKIPNTTRHFSINYLKNQWNDLASQKHAHNLQPLSTKIITNNDKLAETIKIGMKSLTIKNTDIKSIIGLFYQYINFSNKNNPISQVLNPK